MCDRVKRMGGSECQYCWSCDKQGSCGCDYKIINVGRSYSMAIEIPLTGSVLELRDEPALSKAHKASTGHSSSHVWLLCFLYMPCMKAIGLTRQLAFISTQLFLLALSLSRSIIPLSSTVLTGSLSQDKVELMATVWHEWPSS